MSNHPVPANGGSAASAAPRGGKGWRLSAPHETVAPPPSPPQPSAPAVSLATSGEPDLSQVCSNPSDRVVLRNIIYTLYAIHAPGSGTLSSAESSCNSTSSSVASCYIGYNVRRIPGKGYIILAFFSPGFRVSVQDMQLVMDVCPLRVDSLFLRAPHPGDASSTAGAFKIAGVMSISVLDSEQPVRITEAEVVRVRKRSRGLLEQFHSFLWD